MESSWFSHHSHPFCQEDLFGGRGRVLIWDLNQGGLASPFQQVLACELAPGARVGSHRQAQEAEILIVLSGQGTAWVDGQARPLLLGSLVSLPLGSTLALDCPGPDSLRYLIVKATP